VSHLNQAARGCVWNRTAKASSTLHLAARAAMGLRADRVVAA
jgi:hypothetical protein